MPESVFTPNLSATKPVATEPTPDSVPAVGQTESDRMSGGLLLLARSATIGLLFLIPVFFMPGLWATLGFQKALVALGGIAIVVTLLSLLMLRHSRVYTVLPSPLLCFVAFIGAALVSGILSDSPAAALRGSVLETGTVGFLAIMAGLMAIPLVLQQSKKFTMRALQVLMVSALLMLLYTVVRLFVGPIFDMGSFPAVTTSPLGSFNDLAIFAGLAVLSSLISLLQLPLRLSSQVFLLAVTLLSLVVLAVVNFGFIWNIIGFFSLLVLLYVVSRDRLFAVAGEVTNDDKSPTYLMLLVVCAVVCLVGAAFIITGDTVSAQVNRFFDVSYLEVRPSFGATIDVVRGVYSDRLLLGTGPNQFVDAWRSHKDTAINESIFWQTDFVAGSGYVTTMAVTTGVIGLALLVLFHLWYAWFGVRMLLRTTNPDPFWYFAGVLSFAGAAFLWFVSYIYVPGPTVLLLAAVLTGISFVASGGLLPQTVKAVPLVVNRQRGFGLMAIAILVITSSVGMLVTVSEQYIAHASFNRTQASAASLPVADQAALIAYDQYPDPQFMLLRARIALLEMNQLLQVAEPTEATQQQFLDAASRGIAVANEAINVAPNNPEHHAVLAAMYNNLAMAGVGDALSRATTSLETAKALDPKNPSYALVEAQMAAQRGDVAAARAALVDALTLKRNFTEALFLLTQLDIAEGNTESAIATTEVMITLEPNNATRYYQLGILQTAAGNVAAAVNAYTLALNLDPNYANARYYRAVLLASQGETDTAIAELRLVQESNPDNTQLAAIIEQLESGVAVTLPEAGNDEVTTPVAEPTPETDAGDVVTSPVAPDSDLVTPLNAVPDSETDVEVPTEVEPEATTGTDDTETAEETLSEEESAT